MKNLIKQFFSRNKVEIPTKLEKELCDECHSPLIERTGKYGVFLGCSNYPRCKFTKNILHESDDTLLGDQKLLIKNFVSIISGNKMCYRCNQLTTVSGLAISDNDVQFLKSATSVFDFGFDIYIIPWSSSFYQLPIVIQNILQTEFPIQLKYSKTVNQKYWANVCINCGCLQGDNYVYDDTGHGSPFDYLSDEHLILTKVKIYETINLELPFYTLSSPTTYFKDRISHVNNINL
ncbi:topoisomerase DNA-binding C4 zinc finger domain-containing protein [Enterococcus faecalis]|uniref:topoisomerase DNA-binding C4 zinc finger domain-containing protein n=1 Tax=Enterococcus faecalis TaxID=1351 RepID=UPI001BD99FC1|nr:topoisomerase DNA-binding C4 zinc finger domain-containing protein [Enterococcus faecalis]MBT0787420.1 topoisomerase DNA-binding C4 zinc finger domain-containing protein [Enterococcus faecalis]